MTAAIELRNIKKSYADKAVLENFNLAVEKGEFLTVVGSSGCGKTTLLKMINGLIKPTEGDILIDGEDICGKDMIQLRRNIGYAIQGSILFPHMSVEQNIAYVPNLLNKKNKEKTTQAVKKWMKIVGLEEDLKGRYPGELSGGQQQRVAIARALANDPKVLLCDEATSALDPQTTKSILHLLKQVNEKLGITIVIITHEMAVVKDICDRVAIMELGRVVEEGATEDVFVHPKEKVTKDFISTAGNVDKIYELIDEGNDLTKLQEGEKMVMLTYSANNAGEPVISYLAEAFDVKANIIYGNIDILKGKTIGKLVVTLSGKPENMEKALAYIEERKVELEVIKA